MISQPDTELYHRVEMKSLGATIRLLREAQGLSANALAERLEVNKSYVSLLESDARKPSIEVLGRLAISLRVPLGFLVEIGTGDRSEKLHGELKGIFNEFDELERRLSRVLKKLPRSSSAS